MANLAEHWDGSYLGDGWHDVRVKDYRIFTANSGNRGIQFDVEDDNGRKSKTEGIMLMDSCLWKLAQFAQACGIDREQAAAYDPYNDASHRVLLGKRLRVHVGRDDKDDRYHVVDDYEKLESGLPPKERPSSVPLPPRAEPQAPADDDEEIPF